MATFLCTIEYSSRGHELLLEVWVENDKPAGVTTREEVETALREAAASGVAPEGWRISVMNWSHPRSRHEGAGAAQLSEFDGLIRLSDVDVQERERPKPPPAPPEGEGEE